MATAVEEMKVGQSRWIAAQHEWKTRWYAKRLGYVVQLRQENGGFRVWRRA